MRKPLAVALAVGGLAIAATGTTFLATADADRQPSTATGELRQAASRTDAERQPPLRWTACPGPAKGVLECSELRVPLDYGAPEGRTIQIALSRRPASTGAKGADPAKRRVLLLNPGGPGLPGLASPTPVATPLPPSVLDAYQVIGFDPRGVGRSTPLTCGLTPEQSAVASNPPSPRDAADVAEQARTAEQLAEACAASRTGDLMPYMTTANTARDMDRIRAALGVPKVSYYGTSYGTYLGAVYTTLFPTRADRFVLDSSLPPEGYDINALRGQGEGFEARFPDFAAYAAGHAAQYQLGATAGAVREKYFQLAERLDGKPSQGTDGATFRALTSGLLRSDSTFPALAGIWHKLDTDQPLSDPGQGGGAAPGDNFQASHLAVICGDTPWPRDLKTYEDNVAADRARYPMYGPTAATIRPCAYWKAPVEKKVRITGDGPAGQVLMIQNLRDPATPLSGARRMRQALGNRARMVTVDQGGHGAYLFGANRCGNDTVTAYLTTGRLPNGDTSCPAQPSSTGGG
ncbi:alpha/beta hydrolase [Streptomyces sp. NPDC001941]|uniref:alpha/beta hydrolase n=1 Tax=Streptomyces sp. NPDC001941 TaxID=3154659 RepID=UPI0033337F11